MEQISLKSEQFAISTSDELHHHTSRERTYLSRQT